MYQSHLFFISVSLRDFYHNTFYNIMIQQENLKKRLAKLAAPIFIETLLIMMLGAVDTVMLSRHSDNSVAAVGVVNQIIMLTFLVFEVINLGTSVLCSQYIGARLHKQVVQVVGVSILVNLVVGITISMLLFGCAGPILRLMGLGPELMQDGMDYMRIVGAFAFFQALSLTLSASLRSANKAVYPMLVTVVVNILNIIGNYSLIFGRFGFPELGVEGAAISTAFSRGVSMIIPSVPMGGAEESDEGGAAFCRGAAFLQLVAGGNHLFHQYAGSGGACHTYLLRQYYYVRLSVQHLYGTGRSDMYRASDRGEKTACRFSDGEVCDEEVCNDHCDPVRHTCALRAYDFWLADVQSRDYQNGGYCPDD